MLEEKKPKSWLKSVSAFANGLGGSLFYGVNNEGEVKGLDNVQKVGEAISLKIRDYMDPLPDVELIPHRIEGKAVLQVKVNPGSYTPYYYVGDGQRIAFVRNGDESIPATAEEMVRLVLKGSNRTFDSIVTDSRVEDNAFTILSHAFEERVQQAWDKKYLLSFGLVTTDGHLTNAGVLFSDDCRLSQSRLYCTRWNGLEKDDAVNDAEYKGNILLLLREAMNFVKSNTRKGWEKLPDGRKNKPEYAERAVLEGLVNHFIHRDYTVMGGEVHLDIYDDRIVITSPGGMYSGQRVQDIPLEEISSNRRNPVLADVMAQLDYMEKRGSGLKKICNETRRLEAYTEERRPVFKSSVSQFMTTIYSVEYDGKQKSDPEAYQSDPEVVEAGKELARSWQGVGKEFGVDFIMLQQIAELCSEPRSLVEIAEHLGVSDRYKMKKKYIDPMIGRYLEMTQPDAPNSPKQRYVLTIEGKGLK